MAYLEVKRWGGVMEAFLRNPIRMIFSNFSTFRVVNIVKGVLQVFIHDDGTGDGLFQLRQCNSCHFYDLLFDKKVKAIKRKATLHAYYTE